MHQDIVSSLPPGAQNLGDSPVCAIQGMLIPGRVLSVQGHPEFNGFIMGTILDARHGKVFDDELYASGMQRAKAAHDGNLIGGVAWKLILGEI